MAGIAKRFDATVALSALHLYGLRRDGVAILLVPHRLGDGRRIADRVAIGRDGRIVADLAAPVDFDAALETMIGRRVAVRDAATAAWIPAVD